jgi:probable HAF family extracellular repeat protein
MGREISRPGVGRRMAMVTMTATTVARLVVAAIWSVVLLVPAHGFAQDSSYTLIDLGTLGGTRSAALGINNAGHVVGSAETADGRTHAFLYVKSALIDLGTFGGDDSYAHRISDGGLIVGRASTKDGEFRPFVSSATGVPFDLSQIDVRLKGTFSTAVDVNSAGLLVGYRQSHKEHMAARRRVFIYRDFQVVDLGTFGGEDGFVAAINKAGHLVGYFSTQPHADYADHRGFLLDKKGLTDLGSLGGRMTTPTDINDSNQVVGYAQIRSGEHHAFLYHVGRLTDLGTLPGGTQSYAYAINNLGQAVGASDSSAGAQRAVLFDRGTLKDLNRLIPAGADWLLTDARDINDAGQIVGTGVVDGRVRAFLLTPTRGRQ